MTRPVAMARPDLLHPDEVARLGGFEVLTEGIVDLPTMKKLMPLVTGGGSVYRAQVVGYYEEEGPGYRIEAVVDGTKTPPVVKRRRDLVEQGPGFSPDVLGGQADDAK